MKHERKTLKNRRHNARFKTKKGGFFFSKSKSTINKNIFAYLCQHITYLVSTTYNHWKNNYIKLTTPDANNTPYMTGGAKIDKSNKRVEYIVLFINEVFSPIIYSYIDKYAVNIETHINKQINNKPITYTDLNSIAYVKNVQHKMTDVQNFCPELSMSETVINTLLTYSEQQELERYAYKKMYEILNSPNLIRQITETVANSILTAAKIAELTKQKNLLKSESYFVNTAMYTKLKEQQIELLDAIMAKRNAETSEEDEIIKTASENIVNVAKALFLTAYNVRNESLMTTALDAILFHIQNKESPLYLLSKELSDLMDIIYTNNYVSEEITNRLRDVLRLFIAYIK